MLLTFIGGKEFHVNQFRKVTLNSINLFYLRAMNEIPKFARTN